MDLGEWKATDYQQMERKKLNQPRENSNVAFIVKDSHVDDQGISTNLFGVAPKAYICEIP